MAVGAGDGGPSKRNRPPFSFDLASAGASELSASRARSYKKRRPLPYSAQRPTSPSVDRPTVHAQAWAAEPGMSILHAEFGNILSGHTTLFSITFQSFFGHIVSSFNSSPH